MLLELEKDSRKAHMSATLYAEGYLGICSVDGGPTRILCVNGSAADQMLRKEPECGDQLVAMWMEWA